MNIAKLLQQHNAVLIAHYYTPKKVQQLAESTHGFIGDSLEMAKFGSKHPAQTLVIAGVRFMGETAKILNPNKKVLVPSLEADCSLDIACPAQEFAKFCKSHEERTVVVYVNTSAAVKALADWTVTSSSALAIVAHLHSQGKKILWAPDRYLGAYIQQKTGADMLIWPGACIVHEQFKTQAILDLKKNYPTAAILVHPEAPMDVIQIADVVGSTSQLLAATSKLPHTTFIVATEPGILYKMQQQEPQKTFIIAPTYGVSATCQSCAFCHWMKMNTLATIEQCLTTDNEITIPKNISNQALVPLQRMLNF